MDQKKVDFIMTMSRDKFKPMQLAQVVEMLKNADDSKYALAQTVDLKDPNTTLIISIFAGTLGVDRFMIGDTTMGIVKLLTGGGCGVLWIMDIFMISDKVKDYNFHQMQMAINGFPY